MQYPGTSISQRDHLPLPPLRVSFDTLLKNPLGNIVPRDYIPNCHILLLLRRFRGLGTNPHLSQSLAFPIIQKTGSDANPFPPLPFASNHSLFHLLLVRMRSREHPLVEWDHCDWDIALIRDPFR